MNIKAMSLIIVLMTGLVNLRCQRNSDVMVPQPTLTSKIEFEFVATVGMANGNFPVTVGDKVHGTFSFDATTRDVNSDTNKGSYPQVAEGVGVVFNLNDIIFRADIESFPKYIIEVCDDDDYGTDVIRDIFTWYCGDTKLAKTFDVDNVQAAFSFHDFSKESFSDDSLPEDLVLAESVTAELTFSGINEEGNHAFVVWNIFAVVNSLDRTN